MSRINGKLNLASFKNSVITAFGKDLNGIKAGAKVLIIPIEENSLFLSDKGSVYFDFVAFENDKLKDFTHAIKQSFSKEKRESMSKEEQYAQPFFGNIKAESGAGNYQKESTATTVETVEDPF